MIKILQINKLYYPWVGGIEKIVQQIAEGLNKKNSLEVDVLCCRPKGKKKIEIVNSIKLFRTSSLGMFKSMPISFDFLKVFAKLHNQYDIVDFHHPFPLGNIAIFLFPPKGNLVVHYHSDIVRQKWLAPFYGPFVWHNLKKAKKILVSNPNLIKSSPYLRKFRQKCEVIPFGVNLEKFRKKKNQDEVADIKKKYGNFVLFVGRLNYYKGTRYLIEAIKDIPTNLVIIGQGQEEEKLKEIVKAWSLQNKVFFLPSQTREKLINFYYAASVFVLPSIFRSEAFGIVLIEAMACGTPIISTQLETGTSWININGETGFVVPPKNSKALSQAIQKILTNQQLAQQLGQNAKNRVVKEFLLEKMLKKIEQIYCSIISSS